jgi:hypothetical protein
MSENVSGDAPATFFAHPKSEQERLTIWNVYGKLSFIATRPVIGLMVVLGLLAMGQFSVRDHALGPGADTLDGKYQGYTPEQAHEWLCRMGESGRDLYARTQLTLDIAFPIVYGCLWAGLLARWWPCAWARRLVWAPFLTVLADYAENIQAAYLAWTFNPDVVSPVGRWASVATVVKWRLVFLTVGLVAVGGVYRVFGKGCSCGRRTDPPS